jgi:macrolide-specific efflux system membrane fusion protein
MAMKEGTTLNATQQAPTVMQIANLSTMTVETQISEADVGKLWIGMDVYFNTLSGGARRWYSTLRQILPTPIATNNVVTYTGLFDVENDDGALLSGMTTQVYFITSAARGVLTVPVGALVFAAAPRGEEGPMARSGIAGGAGAGGPGGPAGGGAPSGRVVSFERGGAPNAAGPPAGFNGPRGGPAAASRRAQAPRQAKVRVVNRDGSFTERDVTVGVTSRVTAEVIAGLAENEQVVAGIVQAAASSNPAGGNQNGNRNQGFVIPGGGFPGGGFPGGGFPGGGGR